MIVKSNALYSKKQLLIFIIVEIIIALICLAGIILIIVGSIKNEGNIMIIGCVLSPLGFLDLATLLDVLLFKQKHFLYFIFGKLFKHKFKDGPNDYQSDVLSEFFANEENTIKCCTVLVSGKKNSGKSQCTDYIIDNTISKIKAMAIKRQLIYIDCYNDTREASTTINQYNFHDLNNALLIIDNCNEAEWSIIDSLIKLSRKENCSVLIIEEDTEVFRNKLSTLSTDSHKIIPLQFNEELVNNASVNSFLTKNFTILEKKMIFACALHCKFFNIFKYKTIVDALKLDRKNKFICIRILKKLIKAKIIYHFPFNTEYFKFKNVSDLDYIFEYKLKDEKLFDTVIEQVSDTPTFKNDEVAWLIMLCCSKETALKISQEKRHDLFIKAANLCNFQKLYSALKLFTNKYNCEGEFLYEYGYLNYNLDNFSESYVNYENYFSDDDLEKKLRFIEIFHTYNDKETQKRIIAFINALKKEKEPFNLFANYWDLHIKNERGTFCINDMDNVLNALANMPQKDDYIHTHLERCFTDELRMYWITKSLDKEKNIELFDKFENLYKTDKKFKFYKDLYFKAGFYHYVELTNSFLNLQPDERLEKITLAAENAYCEALNDNYGRLRSTATAKIKLAELQCINEDSKYDELIKETNFFKLNSEKKKSSLHIAFALTVKAKIIAVKKLVNPNYMLDKETRKQLDDCLFEAEKIYEDFENKYGVLRCRYLKTLIDILVNTKIRGCKTLIIELNNETQAFALENSFCCKLINTKNISYLDIYNCIKYYPIILQ